jgi:DNA-binding PadR family transcriptional regulator
MDLINQLEALSETERKEHVFYDWLNRMADAGYYSYETVLNMHNKAAAIDGL